MSDLFDGFSESEINDHSSNFSVPRVISESSLQGPVAEFIEKYFRSEKVREQEKFYLAIHAAAKQLNPYEQLEAFLSTYKPKFALDSLTYNYSDGDVAETLKREMAEVDTNEDTTLSALKCIPTRLTEHLKNAFFPASPLELCKTVWPIVKDTPETQHASLALLYLNVLRLYGEPFEVLLKAVADSKSISNKLVDEIIWIPILLADRREKNYDLQVLREAFSLSARWHNRLIALRCFDLAEEWEKGYLQIRDRYIHTHRYQTCAEDYLRERCPEDDFRTVFSQHLDTLAWQRLCHPELRTDTEDSKKWLVLSFDLKKSFCHPNCPEDLIDQYIEESLNVFCWERLESRVPPLKNIGSQKNLRFFPGFYATSDKVRLESPEAYLHMLWYSSLYRDRYLAKLNAQISQSSPSQQLIFFEYLLFKREWKIGPFIPWNSNDECNHPEQDFPRVKVEQEVLNQWARSLVTLGQSCLKKHVRLTHQELTKWLELVDSNRDICSVSREDLVPYADKALAFVRKSLHMENKEAKSSSYPLGYRILLQHAPNKFLSNMLQAFRHCPVPCSGEHLEYGAGSDMVHLSNQPKEWEISILISNCLRLPYAWKEFLEHYPQKLGAGLEGTEAERESAGLTKKSKISNILRKEFAQFCLKSLRLKKKEKLRGQYYEEEQCTETSSIWRQAFIKALTEIGIDLDGQVHRALNFVSNHDPIEGVRNYAREAYNSIRKQEHQMEKHPVKGLLIAFWTLRLAQRKALNQDVIPHEATRTRRNELKYAEKVRYIISYIDH